MFSRVRRSFAAAFAVPVLLVLAALSGCGSGGVLASRVQPEEPLQVPMKGGVHGGQQPVSSATIQLYAVSTNGSANGQAATPLLTGAPVLTDAGGSFYVPAYTCPSATAQTYITATGGNPGLAAGTNNTDIVLMAALGNCGDLGPSTFVSINEVTTVATVAALAPFMTTYTQTGSTSTDAQALLDDFKLVNTLTDFSHGSSPGSVAPVGYTVDAAKIYTLADAIASCINSAGNATAGDGSVCGYLFQYATPPGGSAPANVADAVLDITRNPTQNVAQIFYLVTPAAPFNPSSAPRRQTGTSSRSRRSRCSRAPTPWA